MTSVNSKTRMLILELLLTVVLFSACALVCSAVYIRANELSMQSRELGHAVIAAESAAEAFHISNDVPHLAGLLGGSDRSGVCLVYYNENGSVSAGPTQRFMEVSISEKVKQRVAEISYYNDGQLIYTLQSKKYSPEVSG